ncbi:hypothetical protein BC827DRAFT_206259 [Russula dissimulans]|nr:hypothetical protein BC827DRAFT_206259 [Russula dissimulans]
MGVVKKFTRLRLFSMRKGVLQALIGYLVKWKDYPDEENSWVDERDAIGAKELITEYWSRQGKKKGEKAGRKSDVKPKATTRRPVVASVETTPEPTKKRGRDRSKAKPDGADLDEEELDDTRSRKRGRKSNGVTRKASPSPASSSDRASPIVELLEPSTIKKWGNLPSWERHIETIDTVEKSEEGDLFIYFKLKGEKAACKENSKICAEKFPQELIKFYEAHLKWRQAEAGPDSD